MSHVYVIEIQIDDDEWMRVGRFYRRKEVARSWLSFVKKAWHVRNARIAKVKLTEAKA